MGYYWGYIGIVEKNMETIIYIHIYIYLEDLLSARSIGSTSWLGAFHVAACVQDWGYRRDANNS